MNMTILIGMPGTGEIIVLALIVLLLFGGKKIPELMRGLGRGIREFNSAKANIREEIEQGMTDEEAKAKTSTDKTADKA